MEESIASLKAKYPGVTYHAIPVALGSQASVRAAAAEILELESVPKIDIMINCAGIMGIPELTLSPEGIETHFATNHLGHFLLTCLLPLLPVNPRIGGLYHLRDIQCSVVQK